MMYYVQKWKVWKGIHPTKPQWSDVNLVFSKAEEAEDCVEYLERNNPDEPFRYVRRA